MLVFLHLPTLIIYQLPVKKNREMSVFMLDLLAATASVVWSRLPTNSISEHDAEPCLCVSVKRHRRIRDCQISSLNAV